MHLVKGNHDILKASDYSQMQLIIHEQQLIIGGFCFVHDTANTKIDETFYYISGHIHPGIQMKGLGKQFLKFPCFYFGESIGILPAFGKFTGLAMLEPTNNDTVFAIVNQQVIKVHG
jgi:metallophosphoesterase superfamily enzyme